MTKKELLGILGVAVICLSLSGCRPKQQLSVSPEPKPANPDSAIAIASIEESGADLERGADGRITKVNLAYCKVDEHTMEQLAELSSLNWLVLDGTRVTDELLARLASFDSLENLYLANTAITDRGLKHVASLPGLKRLQLSGTHVTDLGLADLSRLKQLESVWLHNTRVSDQGVAKLQAAMPNAELVY